MVLVIGISVVTIGCTWVKPTTEGKTVQVADADGVSNCERMGKVTVSLKDKIGWMDRKRSKVETELETLARNEGALLGGNMVSPESEIRDGRRVFGVYKCPK